MIFFFQSFYVHTVLWSFDLNEWLISELSDNSKHKYHDLRHAQSDDKMSYLVLKQNPWLNFSFRWSTDDLLLFENIIVILSSYIFMKASEIFSKYKCTSMWGVDIDF